MSRLFDFKIFGVMDINHDIKEDNASVSLRQKSGISYLLNLPVAFLGTFTPWVKFGFEMGLFLFFPLPYFIVLISIRYVLYLVSTILFKISNKKKSSTINQILSILFEKHISYFELAYKYKKEVPNKNIPNNIKFLDGNKNDDYRRLGLKYLPYGLPWMTISTIFEKVITYLYYKLFNKYISKDTNNMFDIYYLSFLDRINKKAENTNNMFKKISAKVSKIPSISHADVVEVM
tara:strand:- start:1708 stop:2406 length:699 start_codon:yes stop_codon:yes gene_type:complete